VTTTKLMRNETADLLAQLNTEIRACHPCGKEMNVPPGVSASAPDYGDPDSPAMTTAA
jgi:hypothetical protein